MCRLRFVILLLVLPLSGCTILERTAHMYGSEAPAPQVFQFKDGGTSIYYAFTAGDSPQPDTAVFFYGATGCPSWKSVIPGYVSGLAVPARVFVLNKRFVADRSTGLFGCGRDFHLANNPGRWLADYSEFITTQLDAAVPRPRNVVLVGVSEGALPAVKVAGLLPEVTHLAIIGSGAYTMRRSLSTLKQKGAIAFDVESGWQAISTDPRSIEKSWYGNRYRWWSDIMDLDPLPDFLQLNIPIIVGIGEQDRSVPVESARFLESKFNEAGKSNLTLIVYPSADHRLGARGISHRSDFFAELSRLLRSTDDSAAERDSAQGARLVP
ncbi:hypothetical protein CCZ27_19655 [Thauera sinica]|nr:hypothetical protein CCZ27_19655 [Thauera sp. K11]